MRARHEIVVKGKVTCLFKTPSGMEYSSIRFLSLDARDASDFHSDIRVTSETMGAGRLSIVARLRHIEDEIRCLSTTLNGPFAQTSRRNCYPAVPWQYSLISIRLLLRDRPYKPLNTYGLRGSIMHPTVYFPSTVHIYTFRFEGHHSKLFAIPSLDRLLLRQRASTVLSPELPSSLLVRAY